MGRAERGESASVSLGDRNPRLAHLVAIARILTPPRIKSLNGVEQITPPLVSDADDAFFQIIDELTGRGMRRPLMKRLEGLLWHELENARVELSASIEKRLRSGSGADNFARLYRDHLRFDPSHFWALLAGGAVTVFRNFDYRKGRYSPEEYERQIRATLRSEYCDALRPGFESHRSEKEKAQRRRTFLAERQTTERIRKHAWVVGGTAVPLSSLQATDEEDDDFADRADWLQGRAFSPSQRDLVERVAVHYSLTPHEWRQGLLFLSFDSAFLDRLAGQKRGWANKRKQRLLANVSLTPKAHRLLAAHEAVQNTISTQSSGWSYVAGLRGRSFPGAFRIRAAKEKRLMQNGNGHKPAGSWSVWTFTAYEPDGPATWWAYQNGAAPIYARTKKRLVEKALAEARLRESFQLSNPASTSSFQSGSYRMIGIQSSETV